MDWGVTSTKAPCMEHILSDMNRGGGPDMGLGLFLSRTVLHHCQVKAYSQRPLQ
jgi:hypothetical protein